MRKSSQTAEPAVLERDHLQSLLDVLAKRGYRVVGPTVRDRAIVYDDLTSLADAPVGWTDEQDGGTYRLKKRNDGALFGYALGPSSWKKLPPPAGGAPVASEDRRQRLSDHGDRPRKHRKFAFIGVRSCELHAIAIQDKVFLDGQVQRPHLQAHGASDLFIVARQLRACRRHLFLRLHEDRAQSDLRV